jgi:hypothetical protein
MVPTSQVSLIWRKVEAVGVPVCVDWLWGKRTMQADSSLHFLIAMMAGHAEYVAGFLY